jgi:hypothetical protein
MNIVQALFGDLTKPGVTDNGQTTYYDNPALAAIGLAKASAKNAQPIPTQYSGDIESPIVEDTNASPSPEPTMGTPSFLRASQGPEGTTAKSPALTKKGALMAVLLGGLQGGMRSAGTKTFGQGFENAEQAPIQMAGAKLGLEREGLQNRVLSQSLPFLGLKTQVDLQKGIADLNKTNAEAARIPGQQKLDEAELAVRNAQALAGNYKEQEGILIDLRTGQPLTPDASGLVSTPADIAPAMGVKPGTRLPAKQITAARNAAYGHLAAADPIVVAQIGVPPVNDPTALADWGKKAEAIKTRMSAAPRVEMTLARPIQVADTANPGDTKYVSAGEAMKQGAAGPQSASVVVPKQAAEAEVPTNIGNQKVAFNTMIDHAELLKKAATALNNRDARLFNSLKNDLKSAFGSSDLTDFNAIANAYNHEVTSVISKGHITDSEVKTGGATMPSNANLETINKVLDSYKALAKSKMKNLNKQKQDAIDQSQHAKPAAQSTPANPHADIGFVPISQ